MKLFFAFPKIAIRDLPFCGLNLQRAHSKINYTYVCVVLLWLIVLLENALQLLNHDDPGYILELLN